MKISFATYSSGALLTKKRVASFIMVCFVAGVCGSYLLGNHFGLLIVMVLGIVCILFAAAAYAWLNEQDRRDYCRAHKEKRAANYIGLALSARDVTQRDTAVTPNVGDNSPL